MSRTLADMTPEERKACVGLWCDNLASTAKEPAPVVLACVQGERCWILHTDLHGEWSCFTLDVVAPRMDLPRVWTPNGEPVPGEWEEKIYQDGIGDYVRFTRQRRYITDWEEA